MSQVAERTIPANAHVARYLADYQRATSPTQPAWLGRARDLALTSFERLGFPTTKLEEWRFTPVGPLVDVPFTLAVDGVDATASFPAISRHAASIVCVNGQVSSRLSSLSQLPQGVRVLGLETALAENPWVVEPYLTKVAPFQLQTFTALNTAFLRDGVVAFLPPHAVLPVPLEVTFMSAAAAGPTVSHPRLLIVAGENSQAQIVERYIGSGRTFTNAVTEIVLGANAVIDHYKLQEEAPDAFHIGAMYLHAARSSLFSSHSLTFGAAIARNDVVAILDGEGIDCTLNGLYLGRDRQLVDNHTTIDHAQPHCGSHEVYKGILGDQSRAVFNGKIVVRIDAQKTDAKQTNKALLLSDEATINTKPQLEIFANDVKCTHGAAIGQLDDDAVFYLRSRGLSADQARAMLIRAFAGDILNRVKIPALKDYLESALTTRLPQTVPQAA